MTDTAIATKTPIASHIKELRKRLMLSMISFVIAAAICYAYAGKIYAFLAQPLAEVYDDPSSKRLIFTGLTEAFFTYIKISCFTGFILAFPFIATQLYFFIAPGLYKKERKVLLPYLIAAPTLFVLGAALVYFYVMPLAWQFFTSFESLGAGSSLPIVLEARISEYLSLVMGLMIGFGIAFQLPVILALATQVGILRAEVLSKKRRYAIVLIFIAAALLTPPDVISQIALAIPLMLLYEISVLICRRIEKSR